MNVKIIFSIIFLFFSTILFGQERLRVEYEVKPYFESSQKEDFEITVLTSSFELLVNNNESAYRIIPKINNSQKPESENTFSVTMSESSNPVYKNTKSKTYFEEAKIQQKKFLIKDSLPVINWKITKESKEIEGFPALMATAVLSDKYKTEIIAWYSPKLNYKTGPDKFWGLPGLILELKTQINYEDDSREGTEYKLKSLKVQISDEKINIPTKGKIVTAKEFSEIQEAYLKKQMEMLNVGIDKD